ncbi:formylglycine-generating enzyme family protein [Marinifilum breve]|uniref:Formylglycine-generating enzyme family protein n=2 Tax=Marinifilum breve TaxID=2184082 RepID=A0A2V3ZZA5_9BACT|nr:formylglycine-generating enzyme family protein [Marinifilum breve]
MVLVEGGTYDLAVGFKKEGDNVVDKHYNVTLDDFYIGKHEVTQAQWLDIMGTKPKGFVGGNMPANNVSKAEVLEFIKKLNAKTGENYRLPTEAEWIYAARGGNQTKGFTYSGSNDLDEVAWHKNNSGMKAHPVGEKLANELGLYDMTGNVWEWCSDTYEDTGRLAYDNTTVTNPKNEKGVFIVSRGGAFNLEWEGFFSINPLNHPFWRGTNRNVNHPESNFESIGFRLAKSK